LEELTLVLKYIEIGWI